MNQHLKNADNPQITGIIPARTRNDSGDWLLQDLDGRPLLHHTLQCGIDADQLDDLTVFTQDEDLRSSAEEFGVEVHEVSETSGDEQLPNTLYLVQILKTLEKKDQLPELFVLLHPNAPLRTAGDVDEAVELYLNEDCDMVLSVTSVKPPQWAVTIKHGFLESVFGDEHLLKSKQSFPDAYLPSSALYVSTPELFRRRNRFFTRQTRPYVLPPTRSVEIDQPSGMEMAEALLAHRRANENNSS